MHHGNDHAQPVKQQRHWRVGGANKHQQPVDQAVVLQQHNPRGNAHQHRCPKRHQHQNHHHVGAPLAQGTEPVRQRVANQNRQQRDDGTHVKSAQQNGAKRRSFFAHLDDVALRVAAQVHRSEQIVRRPARGIFGNRLPIRQLAPALIQRQQVLARLRRVQSGRQRQGAVSAHDERARAAHFAVQTPCQCAGLRCFWQRRQVFDQADISGIGRSSFAIPARQRRTGVYQRVGHLGVFDRAD